MLRLEGVSKRFGEVLAVDALSLEVARGELVTLLGPSGCGKTTTLRMVAGFELATAGRVLLDGRDVTGLSPQRRAVGMVFQNYALFPHLDVFENVAFGLKARRVPAEEIPRRVEEALARVDLPGYGPRRVQQLSGGQQQRVALARALAPEPPLLLLDEPLSNLDAALRERTREELRTLLKGLGITSLFVTHDQEEAFALSDRIALLDHGRLQQLGTPETLYLEPANPFVAGFLGRAGFLDGHVAGVEPEGRILCEIQGDARWPATAADPPALDAGSRVRLLVRPESLALSAEPPRDAAAADANALSGVVVGRRFAGAATFYHVDVAGTPLLVEAAADAAPVGATVRVTLRPGMLGRAFPA